VLSGFLVFSDRVVYPIYSTNQQHFAISTLADQECAGALMWTCITIIYLVPATLVTTRLLGVQNGQAKEFVQPRQLPE
jgi:cytochrome c oxidase assembly factor CtaG